MLGLQLGTVFELFQAPDGLNKMLALLFGTNVADGLKPCVAEGRAADVVPYAFTHDTTLSRPLLKQTVPMAGNKHHGSELHTL